MNAGWMAHAQSGGAADLTFNGTGQTTVQLSGLYARAYDVALQGDGKIIAVGDGQPFRQRGGRLHGPFAI